MLASLSEWTLAVVAVMTMASFFGLTSIVPASGDPTSAVMSYSVTQSGSIYTYTVDLTNTSPSGFYINSFFLEPSMVFLHQLLDR